jgi:hypothetical protein
VFYIAAWPAGTSCLGLMTSMRWWPCSRQESDLRMCSPQGEVVAGAAKTRMPASRIWSSPKSLSFVLQLTNML